MKHILTLLLFSTLALRADTVLNDNGTITRDGVSLNNASDALLNRQVTSAEFMSALNAKIAAMQADRDAALTQLAALQTQITTVLNDQLAALQAQLTAAQAANAVPTATAIQAQIATINALIAQAAKSDKQKALDAAVAAKAAADQALADAQAALAQP